VIYVGIDDTDILGSRGTNQLARAIVQAATDWKCQGIVRHQLLDDPRIPYTSKNGSASIVLERRHASASDLGSAAESRDEVIAICRRVMREWFIVGSDPGLCVTDHVPDVVTQFGQRCKCEVMTQTEARQLAAENGIHLEGLGGTEGGVIGALSAVGLIVTGDDGRVVQLGEWPDDLSGPQPVTTLQNRGIVVEEMDTGLHIENGTIDVGKHLRPNLRQRQTKLFVRKSSDSLTSDFQAIKLT